MKRFFPVSLALLLVMGSLGHVFAAAFCPRMFGHDCCLTKASSLHASQSHQHMHGMVMSSMTEESMQMDGDDMQGMVMNDTEVPPRSSTDESTQFSTSEELVAANKLGQPIETCRHCMSHSGVPNAPISSVGVADQSNRNFGAVPLPISNLVRRSVTLAQIGLPREHAPPRTNAPRHILINVFLI